MKRKIIQLADTTKSITIPRTWVLFHNLQKGESVEVEEHKNMLLIRADREDNSEVEIDLAGLSQDLMWRYLVAAYRKGARKVIIEFNNKKELKIIQDLVKDLLWMVIIKQNQNKLIMKDMFSNDKTDVDDSLKKIFSLLIDLSRDSLEYVKNDDKLSLENIPYQDFNINKFANLSIRLLNIHGYNDRDKAYSVYKIISLLEEIGDEYRRLSSVYGRLGDKASRRVLECFEGVNKLLADYYEMYCDFSRDKVKKFYEDAQETQRKLKDSYEGGNSSDVQILSSLDTILHLIKNLSEENMVVKL